MISPPHGVAELVRFRAQAPMDSTSSQSECSAEYWCKQVERVAIERDRTSFMRIHDYYAPRLHRYLHTLGAPDTVVDELVQEAFLKLWRKAHLFDPARANLSTWLFRVARNLYFDHVRREPHWMPEESGLDQLDHDTAMPSVPRPEAFAEQDLARRAIAALPPMQAKLIRMSFLEAKSHREIAAHLDMPLGTVKSTLRRALSRLQVRMSPPR